MNILLYILFIGSTTFSQHYQSFITEFGIPDTTKISFTVSKTLYIKEKAIGKSIYNKQSKSWKVIIDQEFIDYNYKNPIAIKALIYHELGHILLKLSDCKTKSLMNTKYLDRYLTDKKFNKLKDALKVRADGLTQQ